MHSPTSIGSDDTCKLCGTTSAETASPQCPALSSVRSLIPSDSQLFVDYVLGTVPPRPTVSCCIFIAHSIGYSPLVEVTKKKKKKKIRAHVGLRVYTEVSLAL
ncbi:hypothetical protein GBAR_LOCUS2004 [Geodia barretti]|uniref:Uncharacterized protein n=1 Tax=Geodia barretti TaxID=519541 RepID=A0AA35QYH3_GEOBA|nr:hypothetical protein GBAR_LOCUS2004 [Geodia barretti]